MKNGGRWSGGRKCHTNSQTHPCLSHALELVAVRVLTYFTDIGKLGVIVVRPDAIAGIPKPAAWSGLCDGLDVNVVGPGRRGYMPPQGRAVDPVPFADVLQRGLASPVEVGMAGIERAPAPGITGAPDPNKRQAAIGPSPYFSMDRTTFVLINNGVTMTGSAPATIQTVAPSAVVGVASDAPTATAAVDAYATLTNRPADQVWSGLGAVGSAATTIKATDGSNPLVAIGRASTAVNVDAVASTVAGAVPTTDSSSATAPAAASSSASSPAATGTSPAV